jgi:hypothetical protein
MRSIWQGTHVHRNMPVPEEVREDAITAWVLGCGPPVPPQEEPEERSGLVFLFGPIGEAAGKAVRGAINWWKGNDVRG